MNLIKEFGFRFLMRMLLIMSGFFVIVLMIILAFINYGIIAPINTIARITGSFNYDTPKHREENADRLRSLSIHTGDEIENLYRVFLRSTEDNLTFEKKQQEQMDIISAIAEVYESLTVDFKSRLQALKDDPDLKPWEKVSAAVGISHFDPEADHSVEDVFKRADKNMYEDKLAMKAVRTD